MMPRNLIKRLKNIFKRPNNIFESANLIYLGAQLILPLKFKTQQIRRTGLI